MIQQVGDPQEIYANPANSFVANFIGVTSLLEGKLDGRDGDICSVDVSMGQGAEPLRLRAIGAEGATPGDTVNVSLRPEDVTLHLERPQGTDHGNLIEGNVIDTIYLRDSTVTASARGTSVSSNPAKLSERALESSPSTHGLERPR